MKFETFLKEQKTALLMGFADKYQELFLEYAESQFKEVSKDEMQQIL